MGGWADIARESMVHETWAGPFFVFFLLITTFAITNVLVAVIVENAVSTALQDTEDLQKQMDAERKAACANILQVFRTADVDGDGQLTVEEFHEALLSSEVKKWLVAVGIDVRQASGLFDILDYDSSGVLDFEEF